MKPVKLITSRFEIHSHAVVKVCLGLICFLGFDDGSSWLRAQEIPATTATEHSSLPAPAGSISGSGVSAKADDKVVAENAQAPKNLPGMVPKTTVDKGVAGSLSSTNGSSGNALTGRSSSDHYDPTHPNYQKVSSLSNKSFVTAASGLGNKQYKLPDNFLIPGDDRRVGRPRGLPNLEKEYSTKSYNPNSEQADEFSRKSYKTSANASYRRAHEIKLDDSAAQVFQGDYFNKDSKNDLTKQYSTKLFKGPEADALKRQLAEVQERLSREKNLPTDHPLSIEEVRSLLDKDQKISGVDVAKEKASNSAEESLNGTPPPQQSNDNGSSPANNPAEVTP